MVVFKQQSSSSSSSSSQSSSSRRRSRLRRQERRSQHEEEEEISATPAVAAAGRRRRRRRRSDLHVADRFSSPLSLPRRSTFLLLSLFLISTILFSIIATPCLALPGSRNRQHYFNNNHSQRGRNNRRKSSSSSPPPKKEKKECLYKTLGVSKEDLKNKGDEQAAANVLKKAYRRASLHHHPDKPGGNEEKFKQLSKAYEILSDPDQRRIYDQYGHAGLEQSHNQQNPFAGGGAGASPFGAGMNHHHHHPQNSSPYTQFYSSSSSSSSPSMDPNDIFRHFAGASSSKNQYNKNNMFGGSGGGGFGRSFGFGLNSNMNSNNNFDLEDLLAQMMGGGGGSFTRRTTPMPPRGRQQQRQQQPHQQQPPNTIKSYTRELPCTLEELYVGKTKKIKVTLPNLGAHVYHIDLVKGWKEGTKITFPPPKKSGGGGRADNKSSSFPVRMTFVVKEVETAKTKTSQQRLLRRSGNDLIYRFKLLDPTRTKNEEEHTRVEIVVPMPDGKQVWKRSIPSNSSLLRRGQRLTVPDMGMPIKGGPNRGDLIVEFY